MILSIFIGLLGIGIVITVHEFGHLIAAKISGITVERFSIGWGPRILSFSRGGTEYSISLFPIGGYCKMSGEEMKTGQTDGSIPTKPGDFYAANPFKRIFVSFLGPFFNILFAILLLTILWMPERQYQSWKPRVILASEYDADGQNPADIGGMKSGDVIVSINGEPVSSYRDVQEKVSTRPDQDITVLVDRSGTTVPLMIRTALDKEYGSGKIGIYPWIQPIIGSVVPASAADAAGLSVGDKIISVNDIPVETAMDIQSAVSQEPSTITVSVLRNGEVKTITLVLSYDKGIANFGFNFTPETFTTPARNPLAALAKGFQETWKTISLTFSGFGLLFKGININNAVSGPIRITYLLGSATSAGFAGGIVSGLIAFFSLVSLMSTALGIMNLLPLPALDGGFIVLFLIEAIRGKPFSLKALGKYQFIGFIIIIVLILFSFSNDIFYFMK